MSASKPNKQPVGELSGPRPKERWLMYALLLGASLLFMVPFYWLLISAFQSQQEIYQSPPYLIPAPILDLFQGKASVAEAWGRLTTNLVDVFQETAMVRAFINTTLIAVVQVVLTLFLCSLAGMAFARYRDAPGHRFLFGFVLATMMIPGAVTTIPVFVVLTKLHLINTYWAMILPTAANAFGIFWMRQYVSQNVPDELYDAAAIDGADPFETYWRVVVPVIKPAMAALGVLVLINSWNNLMWAFIVLRTDNMQTMPLLVYMMQGEQLTPYGLVMAAGLIATVPLIVAFLLFQRAFISGVTAGAVKG